MNIQSNCQGVSKEWLNASTLLKELNDSAIPTSQNFIDWSLSDEEEDLQVNRRTRLSLLLPKTRPNHGKNAFPSSMYNVEKYTSEDSKLYNSNVSTSTNERPKSPVFRMKVPLRHTPIDKNAINSGCTSEPHIRTERDLNKAKTKPAKEVDSEPSSPILKSRFKLRKNGKKIYFKDSTLKTSTVICNKERVQCQTNMKLDEENEIVLDYHSCESAPSYNELINDNEINFSKIKRRKILKDDELKFELNKSLKHPEVLCRNDYNILITDCSPPDNIIKKYDSSVSATPSIESQESGTKVKELTSTAKKGSDWVKYLETKTPERNYRGPLNLCPSKAPDSSKKKFKKNGHGDQFRRLLHSWQSNISMWNHQMSLATFNQQISCSTSPQLPSSDFQSLNDITNAQKVPSNLSQSSSLSSHCSGSPDVFQGRKRSGNLECIYRSSSVSTLKSIHISQSNRPNTKMSLDSPSPGYRRNLKDSLEIGSNSPLHLSGLSGKTSFTIPKKHLCVEVVKIEWQTALTMSAICRELDDCSRNTNSSEISARKDRRLLVVFGSIEIKQSTEVEVGSTVKIFAPWQVLKDQALRFPTLFSSYFVVVRSSERPKFARRTSDLLYQNKGLFDMETLASWRCPCMSESHIIPSTCSGGRLELHHSDLGHVLHELEPHLKASTTFNAVTDVSENSSSKRGHYWTVSEAIEQCGGQPDVPVSITVRIRKVFPFKPSYNDTEPSHYLILGQDPSGTFVVVEIPNRPLKSTLKDVLEKGIGTLRTLTHLLVSQRILESQDPALFSMIHSIQAAYNNSINKSPHLRTLFEEQAKRLPQSFCYKFVVSLGQTVASLKIGGGNEGIRVELPRWSVEEIGNFTDSGIRGSISVNILYYLHPHIYVVCQDKMEELKESTEGVEEKLACPIRKVTVMNSVWFPAWIKCDGTIMMSAVVENVAVWRGVLFVDELSRLERIPTSLSVSFQHLLNVVPEFNRDSLLLDLVSVSGVVANIDEETALLWDECSICGESSLYRVSSVNTKCLTCHTENIFPVTKYALEVELEVERGGGEEGKGVRVKLFQTTIINLLKKIPTENNLQNQYQVESLLRARVGPLVCCVKSVEEDHLANSFCLLELPY